MDRKEAKKRAEELVSRMSVEEMASQLRFDAPGIPELKIPAYNWWNEGLHGVARAGTATVFPQAIGLGATFDPELLGEIGSVVGLEARAKYNEASKNEDRDIYKGITLWSPNVNLFRDPRWGRGQETYGEDPVLISDLAVSFIRGLQGRLLGKDGSVSPKGTEDASGGAVPQSGETEEEKERRKAAEAAGEGFLLTAACAKHFAVHSGPEALRHAFDARASMKDLYETYLPAFEACVREADVEAVMGAYNRTNGEPCCAHSYLMDEVLRGKWDFKGHFVSDCWAIRDFHENHHVTGSSEESATLALKRGCDVNCGCTYQDLMSAYRSWNLSEDLLRRSCIRLFTTRFLLGMFDETPFDALTADIVDCLPHRELAKKAVAESTVLLKNDNILPLALAEDKPGSGKCVCLNDGTRVGSIAVIGPNADDRAPLYGNYHGTSSRSITILDGLDIYAGNAVRIRYAKGCHKYLDREEPLADKDDRIAEAVTAAEKSDLIILCLGLDETLEGEEGDTGNSYASGDKPDLLLPAPQRRLMQSVCSLGRPVIVINMTGSAVDLTYADSHARAILQAWYPGGRGGYEIARILFGETAPTGKLPVTFYRNLTGFPAFEDYSMKGRTYRYLEKEPLYPFGFGLTYGKACVRDLTPETALVKADLEEAAASDGATRISGNGLPLKVKVENLSERDVDEVLQVYVQVQDSEFETLHPHLAAFCRIHIPSGEQMEVPVTVPSRAFTVINRKGERIVDGTSALITAGFGQADKRTATLTTTEPAEIEIEFT